MSFDDPDSDPFMPRVHTVDQQMDVLGFERLGSRTSTYHTTAQTPAIAQIQSDHVYASRGFHTGVTVTALNSVEDWGASDHCRLVIKVGEESL